MKITRTSILSNTTNTREIAITEQQLDQMKRMKNIQWLCPQLSADDREFIISGILPEEWDAAFKGTE